MVRTASYVCLHTCWFFSDQGADQSGDRKKQTMLHAIYSTTIFLLLVIIIVLVFVIWRGKNRQGEMLDPIFSFTSAVIPIGQ